MKAKRRHDLKTNELYQSFEHARDFVRTRGNHLLGVAVAVIVVAALAAYWRHVSVQAAAGDWDIYYDLLTKSWEEDPELSTRVRQLAQQTGDRTLALAALQYVARIAWEEAIKSDVVNEAKLKEAKEANEQIIRQYGQDDAAGYAVAIAHRGLAAISETQGDADAARQHYMAILDGAGLEGSPLRNLAQTQLDGLDARMVPVPLADAAPVPKPVPTTTRPAPRAGVPPTPTPATTTRPTAAK